MYCNAAGDLRVDHSSGMHVEMSGVGEISALRRCL